jgi:hypothetical protein
MADIDGDGDLDLVVGAGDGSLVYYENIGTAAAPQYALRTGVANPFDGIDAGDASAPALADLDGDGDMDLMLGAADGTLRYFENLGTAIAPLYQERSGTDHPLDGADVGLASAPVFADLDGDGDLDAIVGDHAGALHYFENTGSATTPIYRERVGVANPLDGVVVGAMSRPALVDLDGDGDLDVLVGESGGTLQFFENTGSGVAPQFEARTGLENPFAGIGFGPSSAPVFADIDGDGDADLVLGEGDGTIRLFANLSTVPPCRAWLCRQVSSMVPAATTSSRPVTVTTW